MFGISVGLDLNNLDGVGLDGGKFKGVQACIRKVHSGPLYSLLFAQFKSWNWES